MNSPATPQLISQRYQMLEPLGSGGMGTVYRGIDTLTNTPVAIKLIKPEVADAEMIERFRREGELLRQLNHPHIVKMLDAFEAEGQDYLIMEIVTGGSLSDLLRQTPQLPLKTVLEIGLDLSDALARAHRLNVIHRDLKPANVLLAEDGTPRLSDFGIARIKDTQDTENGMLVGTLAYMAPELLQGENADTRTDIWAFGVLLYEMLSGQHPFAGDHMGALIHAILSQPIPDLEKLCPAAPIALIDLIYRMLDKDRYLRMPSVRQVGAELEALIEGHNLGVSTKQRLPVIPDRFPTPTPTSIPRQNLPMQPTPFVGRDAELDDLARLIQDNSLVTIQGIGGMGKTRLALEAAARQVFRFVHGVWFVPLAPLNSADVIVPAIAEALQFSFYRPDDPKAQLLDFLREKSLLLVLDNFEHVLAGAALVAEILQAAPGVNILATSRERLNLRAETVYQLGGMDLPGSGEESAAVRLFLQSARRTQPGFAPDDLRDIERICALVQGIPLGIELAAGWVEMLRLDEIVSEIEQSLDFLETNMRDVPERHRSIRAVFEYSWHLLNDEERQLFIQMAVFRGGFTRDAAQVIAGAGLRPLTALVNKSLLRRDASGRYHIHELLRQYAEGYLKEQPALHQQVQERHAIYYTDLLAKQEAILWSPNEKKAIQEIEAEFENIRAGWAWAYDHNQPQVIDKSLHAMTLFFEAVSWFKEAVEIFERWAQKIPSDQVLHWRIRVRQSWLGGRMGMLDQGGQFAHQSLEFFRQHHLNFEMGIALDILCYLAMMRGQYPEALQYAAENLDLARESHHSWRLVRVLANQGYTLFLQGKYAEARRIYEEVIAITEPEGSRSVLAALTNNLGEILHYMRQIQDAIQLFERSLALSREVGNQRGAAVALNNLGNIAHSQSDLAAAKRYYDESLNIYREIGDRRGAADCLKTLGEVLLNEGLYAAGKQSYRESLAIYRELGDKRGEGDCLVMLSFAATMTGDYTGGYQYGEESLAVRHEIGNMTEVADALLHLCENAFIAGDLDRARQYNDEAAAMISAPDFPVPPLSVRCIMNRGMIAFFGGDRAGSLPALEEAMPILEQIGYRWAIRLACCFLGDAHFHLGQLETAESYYRRNLQLSLDIESHDFGIWAVKGMGNLLIEHGQIEQGLSYIAFGADHPLTWQIIRDLSTADLQRFQERFGASRIEAAREQAKSLEFYSLARKILEP